VTTSLSLILVSRLENAATDDGFDQVLEAMSRRLLNLGGGRDRDHYADPVPGATAVGGFSGR
jgi:hypothetical protein